MFLTRRIRQGDSFDLAATLLSLLGPGGSTTRRADGVTYHASVTKQGPVQLAIRRAGDSIVAEAWGTGAESELELLPRMLGMDDEPDAFTPAPGLIKELNRRNRGLRLGSTGRVYEAIAPAVLGQRVTGKEAKDGYRRLVYEYGEMAPGPPGLRLPPEPETIAALSYEEFHRFGIERSRADVLREVARRAKRLEEITAMERDAAYARLHAVRGIGPWTSGHVMGIAWGDRDAVPIGDFHLPDSVAWALAGEPRADDNRMLELLEPYRPHRRRVIVMLKRAGVSAPKYGARMPIQDIRAH